MMKFIPDKDKFESNDCSSSIKLFIRKLSRLFSKFDSSSITNILAWIQGQIQTVIFFNDFSNYSHAIF